jgi:hypothetical protein
MISVIAARVLNRNAQSTPDHGAHASAGNNPESKAEADAAWEQKRLLHYMAGRSIAAVRKPREGRQDINVCNGIALHVHA